MMPGLRQTRSEKSKTFCVSVVTGTFPLCFTRGMFAKLPTGFYFYFLLLCDGANADCTV